MKVARILDKTQAEGPGIRFTVWLQGCPHRCRGCHAKDMWPENGGEDVSVSEILERILSSDGIEGVTFLGGEPLSQAAELSLLVKKIKKAGLSVTVFTGFVYEDIEKHGSREQKEVLENTDLLIDGPYIEEERDFSRPLVGSSNQRFLFLTDRYSKADIEAMKNRIEVRIGTDGRVVINGMGDFPGIAKDLEENGIIRS